MSLFIVHSKRKKNTNLIDFHQTKLGLEIQNCQFLTLFTFRENHKHYIPADSFKKKKNSYFCNKRRKITSLIKHVQVKQFIFEETNYSVLCHFAYYFSFSFIVANISRNNFLLFSELPVYLCDVIACG